MCLFRLISQGWPVDKAVSRSVCGLGDQSDDSLAVFADFRELVKL